MTQSTSTRTEAAIRARMVTRTEKLAEELVRRTSLLTDRRLATLVEFFADECKQRGIPVRELLGEEEG